VGQTYLTAESCKDI